MSEPRGKELINRYRNNYGISSTIEITEDMILKHWKLEKQLAQELLTTTPKNRFEIFEKCYTTLYSELLWLNTSLNTDTNQPLENYKIWTKLIGEPPKTIYEIGSGKGQMISYLANCGYKCRATEITRERGKKFVSNIKNLVWDISDGVHLDQYTMPNYYDVVISNQVIEHLHPNDTLEHFRGVNHILKNGGRYIFDTPHRFSGPCDLSRVFKYNHSIGMHLKEYTFSEIKALLRMAGFQEIDAVLRLPKKLRLFLGIEDIPRLPRLYLDYLCFIENLISLVTLLSIRRKIALSSRFILFSSGIFIVARK